MFVPIFISTLSVILFILYYFSTKKFRYWKKRKVPCVKPVPLFGNYAEYLTMKKYPGHVLQEMCQQYLDAPYFGTFFGTEPAFVVKDPDLIKLIYTQDFQHFSSREISEYTHKELITQNVFFTYGDRWKVLRQNLTPLFSSAKMKNMFYLIEEQTHALEEMLEYETKISDQALIEVKQLFARFTIDCVCSCAFGIASNTMAKDDNNNPFRMIATAIFKPTKFRGFKLAARSIWPAVFYGLGQKCFPVEMYDFLLTILKGTFESRGHKPSQRYDFVDLILNLKKDEYLTGDSIDGKKCKEEIKLKVDDDMLASMAVMFLAAGFETSAITLNFTLFELAKDQYIQRKVFEEIDRYLKKTESKLNYDCMKDLPYLGACILETLRIYPALGISTREVTEDYTLPSGLVLEKGMRVHIPIYYIHHNPEYFPEPDQYKPERHLPDAESRIRPYTFFPFGEGARICIGDKFAKMLVTTGLVTILKTYRVELAEDTPEKPPLDPRVLLTQAKCDLKLKFVQR